VKVQVVVRSFVPAENGLPSQFTHRGYDVEVPDDEVIEGCVYYVGRPNVPPQRAERAATPVRPLPTHEEALNDPSMLYSTPHSSCGMRSHRYTCICECRGCRLNRTALRAPYLKIMPTHKCEADCTYCRMGPFEQTEGRDA
jgi:hypothetical protein